MKFAVLGAGAIGGYVGAVLVEVERRDVDRPRRAPSAMRREASASRAPRGFTVHVAATADFDAMADADVIFVGLKANSLPEVAPSCRRCYPPTGSSSARRMGSRGGTSSDTAAGSTDTSCRASTHDGSVARRFLRNVVGCVVYCSTELIAPGVIRHIEGTRFLSAPRRRHHRPSSGHFRGVQRRRTQVSGCAEPTGAHLAEADRQRSLQSDHHDHTDDDGGAWPVAERPSVRASGDGGIRGGCRSPGRRAPRSRSTRGSTARSRLATTRPRCFWTGRRVNPSNWRA